MKIASWNVNSIKARLPNVLEWLGTENPDILMMQELKCTNDDFPRMEFESLGYHLYLNGQKTYNGVAILSRIEGHNIRTNFRDMADDEARYIGGEFGDFYVACLYLPNGNMDEARYVMKQKWMDDFEIHLRDQLKTEKPCIFGGDYNVIPEAQDCYNPKDWENDALYKPEIRQRFRRYLNLGYVDAFRALNDAPHQFTFWDYQKGRWNRDEGIRIDHFLLSPHAADRLVTCAIDKTPRGKDKASDHTPIILEVAA